MDTKTKLAILGTTIILFGALLIVTQRGGPRDEFRAAFDAEFLTRPDGYPGLRETYELSFPSPPIQMDPGLMYRALKDGAVNVIDAFATDGRIAAYNLVVLHDDRNFFPPYYAAPLARQATLEKYPGLEQTLNTLSGRITDEMMQEMNYLVDEEGSRARDVAKNFLLSENLINTAGNKENTPGKRITIGGKHFTEQEIIGEIMSLLIEYNTDITVERRLNLGGTIICFNALQAGDIDIYAEYTGTGLLHILREEVIQDPDAAYKKVKEAFEEKYGLIWLEPLGFNNTYTLAMRHQEASELGIASISDLAAYLANL